MLIQRLYLRLQAAHVPIHEMYIFLEQYLRDETVIYVCLTHSKTPHPKIELDVSHLWSPCICNNLPQVPHNAFLQHVTVQIPRGEGPETLPEC